MPVATYEQRLVVDAALGSLVAQPGSGAQHVPIRELRYALRDLERERADEVIASCVPRLLTRQGDDYYLSLDGVLASSDPRPAIALRAMLELIAERYGRPDGRRQGTLAWSDVRARSGLRNSDFTITWLTFQAAGVAQGGRSPGSDDDERSPRFAYDFWLKKPDLEAVADHPTVEGFADYQRARYAQETGRGDLLDNLQLWILDVIADHQCAGNSALSAAGIQARHPIPSDLITQRAIAGALGHLSRYLEPAVEAGKVTGYSLTMDGWLRSAARARAAEAIEKTLTFYRERLEGGRAPFESVRWSELQKRFGLPGTDLFLFVAVIHASWLARRIEVRRSTEPNENDAVFERPADLQRIIELHRAADYADYRRADRIEHEIAGRSLTAEATLTLACIYRHLLEQGDWPLTQRLNITLRNQQVRFDEVAVAFPSLFRGIDTSTDGARTHLTLEGVALLPEARDDDALLARVIDYLGCAYAREPGSAHSALEVARKLRVPFDRQLERVVKILAAQGAPFTVQPRTDEVQSWQLTTSEDFLDFRGATSLLDIIRARMKRRQFHYGSRSPRRMPEIVVNLVDDEPESSLIEELLEEASEQAPLVVSRIPRAVILTALTVEFNAVQRLLRDVQEVKLDSGTYYEKGLFERQGRCWEIVLTQIPMGNNRAAVETQRAIREFRPNAVMFVGVAGGIKDVKLGDVVAATKVYGYESGKSVGSEFRPRPDGERASYRMEQQAMADARKTSWRELLTNPTEAAVKVGPIASGEKVVASKRSDVHKLICKSYSDALAVEMEGRGFLEAAHANHVDAIVVRGISDLLTDKSGADRAGWQEIASTNAAAFALHMLSRFEPPTAPTVPPLEEPEADLVTTRSPRRTQNKPSPSMKKRRPPNRRVAKKKSKMK